MKIKKKNVLLIIGILLAFLLTSGISVYAAYKYYATEVSYDKNGTEISVKQALDELYSKRAKIVLAGYGDGTVQTSSSLNWLRMPATLVNEEILQLDTTNNIFTTKKAGKYLFFYGAGSNMANGNPAYFTAYCKVYAGGKLLTTGAFTSNYSVYASYNNFRTDGYICDLDAGEAIYADYTSDGGNVPKRALYKIFYIYN